MKVKTLKGREVYWKPNKIDWEGKSASKFQKSCKQVLAMYWLGDSVSEEMLVPGSNNMRFDFVNFTKKIIVESDGKQHEAFSKFFHNKNIFNFVKSKKRDADKDKFAELNDFKMIRVKSVSELHRVMLEL